MRIVNLFFTGIILMILSGCSSPLSLPAPNGINPVHSLTRHYPSGQKTGLSCHHLKPTVTGQRQSFLIPILFICPLSGMPLHIQNVLVFIRLMARVISGLNIG